MQPKSELIYKDVLVLLFFGLTIYRWNNDLKYLWLFLFVYNLVKQLFAHKEYYKLNNKFY